MRLHPRLSRSGVELAKRFEGLRLKAARLPEGGWTIGYGHTASAREGVEISEADAEALLLYDLSRVASVVEEAVLAPVTDNQFAALTAFAFNIGVENFRRSDALKRLNEGLPLEAAAAIEAWRRADFEGESLLVDALVRRRAAEKILFLTPPDGFRPVPTPLVRPKADRGPLRPAEPGTELEIGLDGDAVVVSRAEEEAGPRDEETPSTQAARSVVARLNAILADEPFAAPPADSPPPLVQTADEAPPAPATWPVDPGGEAEAEPPPPFPWPRAAGGSDVEPLRPTPPRATTAVIEADGEPTRAAGSASKTITLLAVGVFGAALFLLALATILFGRATMTNLTLGLVGLACAAPAVLKLVNRSAERED